MSVVIGVRIPKKLKEELEQLGIDYAREIREYLQRRVKEEKAKKLAEALDKLIEQTIEKDYSTSWIREERESRS
ncbi:transcriptional regulator, CopG family [Pyrobaculum oguniense TE7]|uniref:Transcriptional regulator, CopG family n=1 Tax=Pyrobaculum oguniense (strain DSM 13380 / JCM 10595 / TE7) TaxID=698757 RepID=H6Q8H5_PYROT|nr:transcriptional regulator, CopG family [Pyrobaculum oguniense TE7]